MERRSFLKALGILGVSSLIPKTALPIIDFIEKKEIPNKEKFVNHMTIQRKTYSISGSAQKSQIYFNYEP